ncbi:MAG: class I SAM-dependent methyltransferase [Candidatus Hadarchaeales archaeon]
MIYETMPSEYEIKKIWSQFKTHNCKKILDVGCGSGWFGKHKPYGVQVYGIDMNPAQLELARKYEIALVGDVRNSVTSHLFGKE